MKELKENALNIGGKLANPLTFTLFILTAIFAYSGLALTTNFTLIQSYLASLNFQALMSLLPSLIAGYPPTVSTAVFTMTVITATLIGLNIALLSRVMTAQGATGGLAGSFLGLSVSGCAACTTGVISLAGASIGLGFLPYNGLELNIISILLLGYTSLYISSKDRQKICKV